MFFKYRDNDDSTYNIEFITEIYPPILDTTFSLILAGSAFYLARSVKKTTTRKYNTCLLNWHIVNLVVLGVTYTVAGIFSRKSQAISDGSEDDWRYDYYY